MYNSIRKLFLQSFTFTKLKCVHFCFLISIAEHTKAMCKNKAWDYSEKIILLSLGTELSKIRSGKLSEIRSGAKQL